MICWPFLADEELHELLGLVLHVARLEDAGTRDAHERAGVLVGEVVLGAVVVDVAAFLAVALPVVVVDDADLGLAGVDRLEDDVVAVVDGAVLLDALEPGAGGVLALELEDRGDDRLEVGAGRRERQPSGPLGLGELHDRRRQLGLLDQVGVVDEDGRPRDESGPETARRAVHLGDHVEDLGRELREQSGLLHLGHRRGVLGQEHVRVGGVALLHELVGQLEVLGVAQLDLDPGLLLEGRHDLVEELLVLGVVDDQLRLVLAARGEERGGRGSARPGRARDGCRLIGLPCWWCRAEGDRAAEAAPVAAAPVRDVVDQPPERRCRPRARRAGRRAASGARGGDRPASASGRRRARRRRPGRRRRSATRGTGTAGTHTRASRPIAIVASRTGSSQNPCGAGDQQRGQQQPVARVLRPGRGPPAGEQPGHEQRGVDEVAVVATGRRPEPRDQGGHHEPDREPVRRPPLPCRDPADRREQTGRDHDVDEDLDEPEVPLRLAPGAAAERVVEQQDVAPAVLAADQADRGDPERGGDGDPARPSGPGCARRSAAVGAGEVEPREVRARRRRAGRARRRAA